MSRYDIVFIGTAILDTVIKGFDPKPVSVAGYRAESGSINAGGEGVNGSIASAKLGMKSALLCFLRSGHKLYSPHLPESYSGHNYLCGRRREPKIYNKQRS